MDKMRQEASERDLDFQLEKSLVMLEQIKDGLLHYLSVLFIY